MISKIKVGVVQLTSSTNRSENLKNASELIEKSVNAGAEMVALPEVFSCFTSDSQKWANSESHEDSPTLHFLREQARRHKIFLHGGSFHVRSELNGKVFNRSYVISQKGEILCHYDKMHLFDVQLENGQKYFESEVSLQGQSPVHCMIGGVRMGLSICYDLRFPELYRFLSRSGARLLFVPSAFTYSTGKAHWELLIRARAVENQCYIIAANQCGEHENGLRTWGHSMIVDPWGETLAQASDGQSFAVAEIDFDKQTKLRHNIPVLKHRRMS